MVLATLFHIESVCSTAGVNIVVRPTVAEEDSTDELNLEFIYSTSFARLSAFTPSSGILFRMYCSAHVRHSHRKETYRVEVRNCIKIQFS